MFALRGTTIIGVLAIVWIVWTMLATAPEERINRACEPVVIGGNVLTSVTALIVPQYQDSIDSAIDSTDYGCRYIVWRLLYEDQWKEWVEQQ